MSACQSCEYLRRPGKSDGYCGSGRADLEHAYGPNHPLRKLPSDKGASCQTFEPRKAFEGGE